MQGWGAVLWDALHSLNQKLLLGILSPIVKQKRKNKNPHGSSNQRVEAELTSLGRPECPQGNLYNSRLHSVIGPSSPRGTLSPRTQQDFHRILCYDSALHILGICGHGLMSKSSRQLCISNQS